MEMLVPSPGFNLARASSAPQSFAPLNLSLYQRAGSASSIVCLTSLLQHSNHHQDFALASRHVTVSKRAGIPSFCYFVHPSGIKKTNKTKLGFQHSTAPTLAPKTGAKWESVTGSPHLHLCSSVLKGHMQESLSSLSVQDTVESADL